MSSDDSETPPLVGVIPGGSVPLLCYWDRDQDGYGGRLSGESARPPHEACPDLQTTLGGDCQDFSTDFYPGRSEFCDDRDNDCDGRVDEHATDAGSWYMDEDQDGYGAGAPITNCWPIPGASEVDGDCEDGDPLRSPGADEVCNQLDDDCDGLVDDDPVDMGRWYADADADGYGDSASSLLACEPPTGYVADDADCDDTDPARHPLAAEEDCDDPVDYNCDGSVGYADGDGDGWPACEDCDDAAAGVHPDAVETCDGLDEDCDGVIDPDTSVDAATWYVDNDSDGWGVDSATTRSCSQPSGFAAVDGDCDDAEPTTHPGAAEVCEDGIDNDCDGTNSGCGVWGQIEVALEADLTILGESGADYMTYYQGLSAAGDVNGDGYQDFIIGAGRNRRIGTLAGIAYVHLGGEAVGLGLGDRVATWTGEAAYDEAGWAVAGAGDANADGFDDLLISAPKESTHSGGAGVVYLIHGHTSGTYSLSAAPLRMDGEVNGDYAGAALDGDGDVNGDGYDDVVVAAPNWDQGAGAVYLVLGPINSSLSLANADSLLRGESPYDSAGEDVVILMDTDGDGLDDIGVGANGHQEFAADAGMTYVVTSPSAGTSSLADATARIGGPVDSSSGLEVASAGDMNQDGYGDLLIGAPWEDSNGTHSGQAWLVLGPVSGTVDIADVATTTAQGDSGYEHMGAALDGGQDIDGDGAPDMILGAAATGTNPLPGSVYLFRGPVASGTLVLSDADAELTDTLNVPEAMVGHTAAFLGDANGDGLADLLVGAPWTSVTANVQGAAYLFLGGNP